MRKYFGTDGMRGRANADPITPDVMQRLGMAAGKALMQSERRHLVLIGKDTRLSGYMLQFSLTSGFVAAGVDVLSVGPLPTPAIAMLTTSMRADMGVMITASHNPYYDNGVKLFNADGYKLDDAFEFEIEALMDGARADLRADADDMGQVNVYDGAVGRYMEAVKRTFPKDLTLSDLRIVVDCANGAAYRAGPEAFWELGADVIAHGVNPDGYNINDNCGSMHPERLSELVREHEADMGVAFDGDADRVVLVDEKGDIIDGDQILACIATNMRNDEELKGGAAVSTVMANFALEAYLNGEGLDLHRTQVGDRYVVEHMLANGLNLGGEQSGHVILADHATTGDGIVAALQVMARVVRSDKPASEVCRLFEPTPQILENVRFEGDNPMGSDKVKSVIAATEEDLGDKGRVLVRKSGTEPLIRIMAEAETEDAAKNAVARMREAVEQEIAAG
ncbi:MAG: phosphoglucosamine mutase [Pseudomonadota bacterium]